MVEVDTHNRRDSWLIIGIGFLQGVAIFLLNEFIGRDWLDQNPWLRAALFGLAIFLPPTAQWLIAERRRAGYWLLLGVIAVLAVALGGYAASVENSEDFRTAPEVLIGGGVLAWAVMISLASTWFASGSVGRDYPTLFRLTCRTVLLPLGALTFTVIFTLLLYLWGALFDLIHIDFFKRLFDKDWFNWPARGIVFGVATAILIERPMLMDGVRRAATAIASALLPVVVVIHLVFLVGLAIVGLEPLWATRHATPLVLTLLVAFYLMLNGAHEDGSKLDGRPRPIAAATRIAILLSPVYVAIAAFSLWLRVAQYGWTIDRVISATFIAFVGFVSLSYLIASLRRPFIALPHLGWANLAALAAVFVLSLAINSPLLSPPHIAARSQEARILAGRVALEKIDWDTLAFRLGRPGRAALERLVSANTLAEPVRADAKTAFETTWDRRYDLRDLHRPEMDYVILPDNTPVPRALALVIGTVSCEGACKVLAIDLDGDGEAEMALIGGSFPIYRKEGETWSYFGTFFDLNNLPIAERDAFVAKLVAGAGQPVPSLRRDLEIDGRRFTWR